MSRRALPVLGAGGEVAGFKVQVRISCTAESAPVPEVKPAYAVLPPRTVGVRLVCWSRRDKWVLGFGPFPIVLSTNLFLWFRDDWFYLQFALVALGLAAAHRHGVARDAQLHVPVAEGGRTLVGTRCREAVRRHLHARDRQTSR